jgi:hypothetical protein
MLKSLAFVVIHPLEFITHQQSASTVAGSIQQEDKMCEVCEDRGCTNCAPQNKELQFASGKEIEEFYDSYGESLWVDPAESTEEVSSSL